jgi:L-ascorbate metabolism protein UlaG (beta-lactamase superfamily)
MGRLLHLAEIMRKRASVNVAYSAVVLFTLGAAQQWPVSDHFDGTHFFNHEPTPRDQLHDFLRKIQPGRDRGSWKKWQDLPTDSPPARINGGDLRVTFVNHATVLLQMNGLNILTDPVWATRLAPLPGGTLKRHRPAGIRFEDLPHIDVVLISHNHFDHMDVGTLKKLDRAFHPRIITGLGNTAYLSNNGVHGSQDIDWWQSVPVGNGVSITGVPARHWSARTLDDADRTLWLGFVIESPEGDVYFAGDTGFTRDFAMIRERYGQRGRAPFRLAILPIAPGRPHDDMASRHMDAADAVRAFHVLGAKQAMGVHFGTFVQGDDGEDEQALRIHDMVRESGNTLNFFTLRNGQSVLLPRPAPAGR